MGLVETAKCDERKRDACMMGRVPTSDVGRWILDV
jgi:hypothetical protein